MRRKRIDIPPERSRAGWLNLLKEWEVGCLSARSSHKGTQTRAEGECGVDGVEIRGGSIPARNSGIRMLIERIGMGL